MLIEFFYAIKDGFQNSKRNIKLVFLTIVLGLSVLFPSGILDFSRFEAEDLILAEREGVANCMTYLKLKVNNNVLQKSICFGVDKYKGTYTISGDSIYFFFPENHDAIGIVRFDSSEIQNHIGYLDYFYKIRPEPKMTLTLTKYNSAIKK